MLSYCTPYDVAVARNFVWRGLRTKIETPKASKGCREEDGMWRAIPLPDISNKKCPHRIDFKKITTASWSWQGSLCSFLKGFRKCLFAIFSGSTPALKLE